MRSVNADSRAGGYDQYRTVPTYFTSPFSIVATPQDTPEIDRRLQEAFGDPQRQRPEPDTVEALVATVLSQHTTGPNSDRALATLRQRFPSWELVADADPAEIADAIRSAGLANQKAPRIKGMLQEIARRRGTLELQFLAAMPVGEAMDWLVGLPGVGQTTAACVLLFGMGRPAMPVDTGISRVAERLGLARPHEPSSSVQKVLQSVTEEDRVYPLHVNLIRHAREICRPRDPFCGVCPLNDLCASFLRHRKSC